MFHHFLFGGKRYQYENTRQYLRLPATWPTKCVVKTVTDGKGVTTTKDLSAGGVALIVREMIPVGSEVDLQIYVPPLNRTISAEGRVVRCLPLRRGGFELGIRFSKIDPKDQIALNETVEKLLPPRQRSRWGGTWWRRLP